MYIYIFLTLVCIMSKIFPKIIIKPLKKKVQNMIYCKYNNYSRKETNNKPDNNAEKD